MTPSPHSRRWFHIGASDRSDALPKCLLSSWELQRRFRPQVLVLEDRNAPGSLLGDLLADALTAALLPPTVGHEPRPGDDGPRREVLRFSLPEGDSPAPVSPVTLRGGDDTGTAGGGVVSVRDGDGPAFFWPPEPAANALLPNTAADPIALPRDASGLNAPVSTGNGVGVRVPAAQVPSLESGASPTFLAATPPVLDAPTSTNFDGSFRVQNEIEPDPDEPPNNAPIAVDDTTSLDEDGFAVIDVTNNDTDADTLRVDGWDAEPEHGTLLLNEDGRITYTPFRDFNGFESFTVNVTDGEAVATATVTLTVNPVNDDPLAFHDGLSFRNLVADGSPEWPAEVPYPYVATQAPSILANDYDLDGDMLTVADLDFTNTVGTVVVNAWSGDVTWEGPWDFVGETSFRYKVADGAGGLSDWATARLWSYAPQYSQVGDGVPVEIPPGPPAIAVEDLVPVGDTVGTDAVMGNDTNGYVAVVLSHPSSTRLTSFGFDGAFDFRPGVPRVDDVFSYRLFGPGGATFSIAQVQMPVVNVELYHGQGGKAVRDGDDETKIGAFTVANLNDTDGDFIPDYKDDLGVRIEHSKRGISENEKDLMQVVVYRPTGFPANPQDTISLAITQGSGRFYTNSFREGKSQTTLALDANSFGGGSKVTYWLESFAPSASPRDIAVEMTYRNATDRALATGVWAGFSMPADLRTSGRDLAEDFNNDRYIETFIDTTPIADATINRPDISLGMQPMHLVQMRNGTYTVRLNNAVEFRFTISPAGLNEPLVRFDITRSVEVRRLDGAAGTGPFIQKTVAVFSDYRGNSNDDTGDEDENNTPINNRIYSLDQPGRSRPGVTAEDVKNGNLPLQRGFRLHRPVLASYATWRPGRSATDGSRSPRSCAGSPRRPAAGGAGRRTSRSAPGTPAPASPAGFSPRSRSV